MAHFGRGETHLKNGLTMREVNSPHPVHVRSLTPLREHKEASDQMGPLSAVAALGGYGVAGLAETAPGALGSPSPAPNTPGRSSSVGKKREGPSSFNFPTAASISFATSPRGMGAHKGMDAGLAAVSIDMHPAFNRVTGASTPKPANPPTDGMPAALNLTGKIEGGGGALSGSMRAGYTKAYTRHKSRGSSLGATSRSAAAGSELSPGFSMSLGSPSAGFQDAFSPTSSQAFAGEGTGMGGGAVGAASAAISAPVNLGNTAASFFSLSAAPPAALQGVASPVTAPALTVSAPAAAPAPAIPSLRRKSSSAHVLLGLTPGASASFVDGGGRGAGGAVGSGLASPLQQTYSMHGTPLPETPSASFAASRENSWFKMPGFR